MMDFKLLRLKTSYESGIDDLVGDFYIPVLSNARRYDRIAGFFSSTSLALASRGIYGLIHNNGNMRLICSPRLSKTDADMLNEVTEDTDGVLDKALLSGISIDNIEDSFIRNHVMALGWMLANHYLEIKLAVLVQNNMLLYGKNVPMLHQKVGVFYDGDSNVLSFSGSSNESASGWLENVEEFKVFKGWEQGQYPYVKADLDKFDALWNDRRCGVKVFDLPQAVSKQLIEYSQDFDVETISLEKHYVYFNNRKSPIPVRQKQSLQLFSYQQEAVNKWVSVGFNMLLEMATGTGKTRTSIGCIEYVLKTVHDRPIIVVIACPQSTLSMQWKRDIDSIDISVDDSIVCDGSVGSRKWYPMLRKKLAYMQLSRNRQLRLIVYTTHQTACDSEFVSLMSGAGKRILTFLIGDEVHGMGAEKTHLGLLDRYEYRLGLSATPERWFDEAGSRLIEEYFGNERFEFGLKDALTTYNKLTGKTFLVQFDYHPHFVMLTDDELEQYHNLTLRIVRAIGSDNGVGYASLLERLLFQRANIEKNAEMKYTMLEDVLDDIGSDISDTIIFVSDSQLSRVLLMLKERGIRAHQFTQAESTVPSDRFEGLSERDHLIRQFSNGSYQVLVAIKCLDEGIDIPSAKRAIVMASSTNPREYIQRIGRIIRQAPGKTKADIHDLIIRPDVSGFRDNLFSELEKRIFRKEMDRVLSLSELALNNTQVTMAVYRILHEVER